MKLTLICSICGCSTQANSLYTNQSVYISSIGQYQTVVSQRLTVSECSCIKQHINELTNKINYLNQVIDQNQKPGKKDDLIQQFQKALNTIDQLIQRNKELTDTIQMLRAR